MDRFLKALIQPPLLDPDRNIVASSSFIRTLGHKVDQFLRETGVLPDSSTEGNLEGCHRQVCGNLEGAKAFPHVGALLLLGHTAVVLEAN